MRKLAWQLGVLLAGSSACTFESTSASSGNGGVAAVEDDAQTTATGGSMTDASESGLTSNSGESDGSAATDDASADSQSSSGATLSGGPTGSSSVGTTQGPVVECPATFEMLLWSSDASVVEPMELFEDPDAEMTPDVAVSEVAESGDVTFTFDLPCAGSFYVWGLVWDFWPGGFANADPDSFYIAGTEAADITWRYGCQTQDDDSGLSWQPLQRLDKQPCFVTPVVLQTEEATVGQQLSFRNREAGDLVWDPEVAGIAAIVISSDPDFNPYDLYTPYP